MKNRIADLVLALLFASIACFALAQAARAQDLGAPELLLAAPPDPAPLLAAPEPATLVAQLALRWPVLSTVLMVVGLLRLLVKPVMAYLRARAAATAATDDDERLDRIERSWWLRALLFALDWGASIKPPNARS